MATMNAILGTVLTFTFKFVRNHVELAIGLEPDHAPISVLVYRQATFPIERQTIRAGLTVLRNIRAFVTAFLAEYSELSISFRCIFVDRVVVRIAKKQEAAFAIPNRPFRELESFGQFENFRV